MMYDTSLKQFDHRKIDILAWVLLFWNLQPETEVAFKSGWSAVVIQLGKSAH